MQWIVAGVVLLVAGSAAAVDTKPPTVGPQRQAVSVQSLGLTARFAVDRLKTSLLVGDEIGHVSLGVFCINRQAVRATEQSIRAIGSFETSVATQLLKKNGFPMASLGEASAYSSDVAAAPDYRLGGIIRELKFDTCRTGNEIEGWFHMKIDWALYSEREQKVVYQLTVDGLAQSSKKVPDLARLAVVSAVENFIGSPGFLEAVKPGSAALLAAAATGTAPAADAPKPAAASIDKPPTVAVLAPIKAEPGELKVRLAVDRPKVALLPGDEIGQASSGGFCGNPRPLTANDNFIANYGGFIATVVQQALRKNGYPLAAQARTSAFDTEQAGPPEFRLGGVLRELQIQVCESGNQSEGWIRAKVDWALYSEKAKRVVVQRSTEGAFFSKEKIPDLGSRAFTVAIENFLAAPEVLAALKATPDSVAAVPATAASGAATLPTAASPARALQLAGGVPTPGGAQKNQARLRAAVVTLESAKGTGSGFYIDRQGYLLTNFHVVSGAKFLKVKLLNGDRLVAEVVKVSERDDVALLKTLPVELEPLAVRPDALDVGEEVFAIGTPLGVLESTMTRGVLSADRVSQGTRELQSDAAVTFGSSGGPLLDGDGRVVGITKGGIRSGVGFNFFIPVLDALRVLDVAVGGARSAAGAAGVSGTPSPATGAPATATSP